MSDIVDRLRGMATIAVSSPGRSMRSDQAAAMREAADEIERLRILCGAYEEGNRMAAALRDQNPCTECSGTGQRAAQSMTVAGREAEIARLRAVIAGIESGGWRVVPAEPTYEMQCAWEWRETRWQAAECYKAMLAAAPRVKP
jgi:hypothetical protein